MSLKVWQEVTHVNPWGSSLVPLPTECVLLAGQNPDPRYMTFARVNGANCWLYGGQLLKYNLLAVALEASGERFRGTGYFPEAYDIELWDDYGCDGHIEYEYQSTWRLTSEIEGVTVRERIGQWSGAELMADVASAVRKFKGIEL
jgi:hypothetical protein